MNVPFMDLGGMHKSLASDIERAMRDVVNDSAFSGGPYVERFEREFAQYCGSGWCVAVGSGTEALWLSLVALGIGRGDEVVTSPCTFFATAEAVSLTGATPVFADVDPRTGTLDPDSLEFAITPRTRAVIPVHLYGQPADMTRILDAATRHGLAVVEDACQAHGALYRGRAAGALGDAGCFSFYPSKNLGSMGEAGAVVTDNEVVAEMVRWLRDHGQAGRHDHRLVGINGRMDGLQAAVLSVKLPHLDAWNERRRELAARYGERLAGLGAVLPSQGEHTRHSWHLYAVRVPESIGRDAVMASMREQGVGCAVHYPVPAHLQPPYRRLGWAEGSLPEAEALAKSTLSLPLHPFLTDAEQDAVCLAFERTMSSLAPREMRREATA